MAYAVGKAANPGLRSMSPVAVRRKRGRTWSELLPQIRMILASCSRS
jgi:hypothetical protein